MAKKRKRGVLAGAKTNRNSHSTMIAEAISAVEIAKGCPEITKVVLGLIQSITPLRGARPHLKFVSMSGALRMQVRGQDSVQFIWLYTKEEETAIKYITDRWEA